MKFLSLGEFKKKVLLKEGQGRVPLIYELSNDFQTPVALYARFQKEKFRFLLESVQGGEKWGRYSFIGLFPSVVIKSRGDQVTILENGKKKSSSLSTLKCCDALEVVKNILDRYPLATSTDGTRFLGGAVGFVSYDMVRFFEKLPQQAKDDRYLPDLCFMIPQILLIADNLEQTLRIVYDARISDQKSISTEYKKGVSLIKSVVKTLKKPLKEIRQNQKKISFKWKESFGEKDFKKSVEKVREYIAAGDITQTVLSNRFEVKASLSSFSVYRALRHINPSPYLFHFQFDEGALVGASPETMVRLDQGKMTLRPIAGTRPRGISEEDDKKLEKELLADPKERAEHVMLVDLGRNDLGRVAVGGTVYVDELMTIERYSHVMHIVSNVRAQLKKGKDMFDVLRATFPAGTLSGSPKVRAMQIIEELEPVRRGPYGGCVGYFDFSGNMDMAITIRSAFFHKGKIYIQSGAGIVSDSDPEKEYQEVCSKARAMMKAVELC